MLLVLVYVRVTVYSVASLVCMYIYTIGCLHIRKYVLRLCMYTDVHMYMYSYRCIVLCMKMYGHYGL